MNWLRKAAARVYDGSFQIGWRIGRWPWQDPHKGERAVRALLLTVALVVAGWVSQAHPRVAELAIVVWIVKAFRAGEAEEEQAEEREETSAIVAEVPEFTAEDTRQIIVDSVLHLADGKNGVHLDRLLSYMHEDGLDMTLSQFRVWVESCGVPVRASLKAHGKTRIGIHIADLPQPAETPPPAEDTDPAQGR